MRTFIEAKNAYVKDHLSKPLKASNIRLGALKNIKLSLKEKGKSLLERNTNFKKFNESSFLDFHLKLQGKPFNSAEKSVIHRLFKFSN